MRREKTGSWQMRQILPPKQQL